MSTKSPRSEKPTFGSALRVKHWDEIRRLATPTVMTMLSQTMMWTVDTILVGHVSSLALGAVGLGGILTWTCYSLFNGLSRVSGTFISQAHGRDDDDAIGDYLWQGLYLALLAGIILAFLGWWSHLLLPLTRIEPEVLAQAHVYIKWRMLSAPGTQLTFCLMGFFQGRRDVITPMWAGIVGNIVNLVLDIWLIYGWSGVQIGDWTLLAVPAMGVKGASIATSIGVTANVLILVWWALVPRELRRRFRTHLPRRLHPRQLGDIVRVGAPAAWENFVDMAAFSIFTAIVGRGGAASLAANQITIQILSFSFMPMWGLTQAATVLTGNWLGAGKPAKAAEYARQVYKVGLYYAIGLAVVLILGRGLVFRVFSPDPEILALGATLCIAAGVFQIFDGMRMVSIGVLSGAGDTRFPMFTSMIVLWLGWIPLTWYLVGVRGGDVTVAWMGGCIAYFAQAVVMYLRFRSNRWQRIEIFS